MNASTLGPDALLRMVLYFAVFRHPLTREEATRLVAPGHAEPVARWAATLERAGLLETSGPYLLPPGEGAWVARRQERVRWAERRWAGAHRAARLVAELPFVRGVLITGGMSKNACDAEADVDFFLIVEPQRLWLLKSGLQVGRRMLPKAVREWLCTNYLIAEDRLEIDERNVFTAIELATAVPMYGPEACVALLEANRWAENFVPGLSWSLERARNAPERPRSRWARGVERLTSGRGDVWDARALDWWNAYWDRKYGWLDDGARTKRFKRRADVSTNHLNDFQGWVVSEWTARCEAAGVALDR